MNLQTEDKTMLKVIRRLIFSILIIALVVIAIHALFNYGIGHYGDLIKEHGFWGSIKEFFVEIWTGFKTTCGIK